MGRKVESDPIFNGNFFLHSGKFTSNPKMKVWNMIFLSRQVIFRFNSNFQGCVLVRNSDDGFER